MEADGKPGDSGSQFNNKYFCSVNTYYSFEIKKKIIACLKHKTSVLCGE